MSKTHVKHDANIATNSNSIIIHLETSGEETRRIDNTTALPAAPITLKEFIDRTSAHGLSDFYYSESWAGKTTWMLVLLLMLSFLIYGVVTSIREFKMNPIITSISVSYDVPKEFPDIYICPHPFFDFQALSRANAVTISAVKTLYGENSRAEIMGGRSRVDELENSTISNSTDMTQIYLSELKSYLSNILVRPDYLFARCSGPDGLIDCSTLSFFIIYDVGIFYRISSRHTVHFLLEALEVSLNLQANDGRIQSFSGVTIGVSPVGNTPAALTRTWMAQGRTYSKLRLAQTTKKAADAHHYHGHRCLEHVNAVLNAMRILNTTIYTADACTLDCGLQYFASALKCIPAIDPSLVKLQRGRKQRVCSVNEVDNHNVQSVPKPLLEEVEQCSANCIPACNQSYYEGTLTSRDYYDPTMAMMILSNQSNWVLQNYSKQHGNMMVIEIGFSSLDVTNIIESSSQTPSMFLSKVGGYFGLWIGASLMTIAQLLAFCLSFLFQKLYAKCCRRNGPIAVTQ